VGETRIRHHEPRRGMAGKAWLYERVPGHACRDLVFSAQAAFTVGPYGTSFPAASQREFQRLSCPRSAPRGRGNSSLWTLT
jgi:hypothetical protein